MSLNLILQQKNISLNAIVACCNNNGIGFQNKMPWHISEDLKYFKKVTQGHHLILGRKTFESFGAKPLPGREHFIISSNAAKFARKYSFEKVHWCESFAQAVEKALGGTNLVEKKIFVIGGESVYVQALPFVQKIYLTRIKQEFFCDTFFPAFEQNFFLSQSLPLALNPLENSEILFQIETEIWERKKA
jgi:dihydrofolate reductase